VIRGTNAHSLLLGDFLTAIGILSERARRFLNKLPRRLEVPRFGLRFTDESRKV
jgi:hypothetical protein